VPLPIRAQKDRNEGETMSRPWIDAKTGEPLFDDYVHQMPSYKKVLRDGFVTAEELEDQSLKVSGLLQQFEQMLEPEEKAVATALLCEWAVLNAMKTVNVDAPKTTPND
jgi:hypothetical protein